MLSARMAGWEIEIVNVDTQQPEAAVVKRVDGEMNCALVVFENGRKEWMDLSSARFKLVCRPAADEYRSPSRRTAPIERSATSQVLIESEASVYGGSGRTMQGDVVDSSGSALTPIPILAIPTRPSGEPISDSRDPRSFTTMTVDGLTVNAENFDWYTEGGHVELCDTAGRFEEGAILCSKTETHVQLFNEHRQFFEIPIGSQPFKVVIHGLLTLKTIPLGQTVDVYSPMIGSFRSGIILKTAELGHLTPISFPPGKTVEWLDLSSQTFKLVFAPSGELRNVEFSRNPEQASVNTHPSPVRSHYPKRQVHYPHLMLGQRVELLNEQSKQYLKYKVAKVLDIGAHEYIFEPHTSNTSPVKGSPETNQATVVGVLPQLRCRILLHASQWQEYEEMLIGHRVDVYDKISKSVACGTVMEVAPIDSEPSLLVRYKDGRREWVFLKSSKVKLRLHGHSIAESSGTASPSPIAYHVKSKQLETSPVKSGELTHGKKANPNGEAVDIVREPSVASYKPMPVRRLSDCPSSDSPNHQQSAFTNSLRPISFDEMDPSDKKSTKLTLSQDKAPTSAIRPKLRRQLSNCDGSDLPAHQQSKYVFDGEIHEVINPPIMKPLDLGQLVRFAPSDTDDGTENGDVQSLDIDQVLCADNSGRKFIIEPPSDMDLWTEELDPTEGVIQYVHVLTGVRQIPRPQWLRKVDTVSGKVFAVHTPTNSVIELPARQPTSDRSSGRVSGRLVLPVGPLEAVRSQVVLEQLPTSSVAPG